MFRIDVLSLKHVPLSVGAVMAVAIVLLAVTPASAVKVRSPLKGNLLTFHVERSGSDAVITTTPDEGFYVATNACISPSDNMAIKYGSSPDLTLMVEAPPSVQTSECETYSPGYILPQSTQIMCTGSVNGQCILTVIHVNK